MASGATSKYALPYPQPADPPNIPGDVQSLANLLDSIIAAAYSGTAASRPAAGKSGRSYYATDTQELSFDTGSAWVALGLVSSSGALITPIVPGQAAGAGSSGLAADAGHVHSAPAFSGTGDITPASPGQTTVAGASGRFADGAHQHSTPAWGGSGDIAALAFGGSAAAGSSGKYADAGHTHAMPAAPTSLLGTTLYAPASGTALNAGGGTPSWLAPSSASLNVAFTAPASGRVLLRMNGLVGISDNGITAAFLVAFAQHGTTSPVSSTASVFRSWQNNIGQDVSAAVVATGLTPGQAYTLDLLTAVNTQNGSTYAYLYVGPSPTPNLSLLNFYAPMLLEAWGA